MADLRNTIAHIFEHKQHLAGVNEATTQQYVVLPILRALGWDDTNLASMDVIPEYKVENRRADYALHIQREQNPVVLIECKRWDQPIGKNEEQICFYAYSGNVPLAIITNGKLWRFYLSRWEASSLSDRIFCETDIENREDAISNLEKYLLKSNVASEEAELNAYIALEESEETDPSKSSAVNSVTGRPSDIIDSTLSNQKVTNNRKSTENDTNEGTIVRVKDSLSQELRSNYEKIYPEERLKLFYRGVEGVQNLIEEKGWRLNPPKISNMLCGFWLTDKGIIGNIRRVFGLLPDVGFPTEIVDRDGDLIKKTRASIPPRLFVRITEEEAEALEREHDGCEFCGISKDKSADYVYYDIPENISELLPVLEFAYNKHRGQ